MNLGRRVEIKSSNVSGGFSKHHIFLFYESKGRRKWKLAPTIDTKKGHTKPPVYPRSTLGMRHAFATVEVLNTLSFDYRHADVENFPMDRQSITSNKHFVGAGCWVWDCSSGRSSQASSSSRVQLLYPVSQTRPSASSFYVLFPRSLLGRLDEVARG